MIKNQEIPQHIVFCTRGMELIARIAHSLRNYSHAGDFHFFRRVLLAEHVSTGTTVVYTIGEGELIVAFWKLARFRLVLLIPFYRFDMPRVCGQIFGRQGIGTVERTVAGARHSEPPWSRAIAHGACWKRHGVRKCAGRAFPFSFRASIGPRRY